MKIKNLLIVLFVIVLISCSHSQDNAATQHDVQSSRESALKQWKDMKFGMFIHWGIYSIPAGVWNGKRIEKLGEQIQRHAYIPHEEYVQLASQFNPVHFNADSIVSLAKDAGMNYIVLTVKHHDGFCMFESAHTDFDIIDASPYKKDILKQLSDACQKQGLKLGIYYSTPDWHFNGPNPEVNPDDGKISVFGKVSKENEEYQVNQLKELMTNYGDIVELFFDMGEPTHAQSKRFAETIHELQPQCVINGRIMNNQGDFITMPDNHVPDVPVDSLAWESPGTFYHTWGYKSWVKGAPLQIQVKEQIHKLARIAARGGNFLLNIGPKSDGSVLQYERDVLKGIGKWMKVNSEAIYHTGTTPFVRLPWGECTTKDNKLYFFVMDWPSNNKLLIPGLNNTIKNIHALHQPSGKIISRRETEDIFLDLTEITPDKNLTVICVEYEKELNIIPPSVKADNSGKFLISGNNAVKHGKYGRESYRSILNDYYRSWLLDIKNKGEYDVFLTYKIKYTEKDFRLNIAGNQLDFTLKGDGLSKVVTTIIDGNEEAQQLKPTSNKGKRYRVSIGSVNIEKTGKISLELKQGQEFDFKTTMVEFKKQDPKYRSMNIDIESIEVTPILEQYFQGKM